MTGPIVRSAPPPRTASWSDPATARAYEAFCAAHDRYAVVNAALARRAALAGARAVLDVGAGIGGTTAAALDHLAAEARVCCVEPSAAMRGRGRRRVTDPRVRWTHRLPAPPATFDRVLCGASVWLLGTLDDVLPRLATLVAPGGALVFDVPAAYAGAPDRAADPLTAIPAWLVRRGYAHRRGATPEPRTVPDAHAVDAILAATGLRGERWWTRVRFTQAAYRDWLKIPVVSDGMLAGRAPAARARVLDAAFAAVDPDAWRWERWVGWTAWKR
jgi:SAM-dependent methyltransferase